jgi:hypothetical protein
LNFIVDDIGKVVEAMRGAVFTDEFGPEFVAKEIPYYKYGHRVEISRILDEMNRNPTQQNKKYPLVALRLDTTEEISNGIWHFNLNIAIVNYTKQEYNAAQRYDQVFKPVLYPLYLRFLEALKQSGLFFWPGDQAFPPHKKIDRLFWGTTGAEGNIKKIFNDPLDAIELIDLKLNQELKTC